MRTVAAVEALARCFSRDQEFLLLDVGTAGGEMLAAIGDVFTKLTAVGVDGLLETLSTRLAPAWAAQADATQLPFRTDSFDACLLAAVLKHVRRADKALAEVARVVKPGGVVVLIEPNALAIRIGCLVGYFPRSSVAHIFTAGRLRKMLTRAGFEVISVDYLVVHTPWNWLNSALNCAFKALRLCVILPAWMVFVCRPKERPEYRSGLADP